MYPNHLYVHRDVVVGVDEERELFLPALGDRLGPPRGPLLGAGEHEHVEVQLHHRLAHLGAKRAPLELRT
jgi:hypothetical protein